MDKEFQHTAARRRLGCVAVRADRADRFNTQPPEGGWGVLTAIERLMAVSTHSRPKAAGPFPGSVFAELMFQHTAARRRLR